jgi:hypothetical protein
VIDVKFLSEPPARRSLERPVFERGLHYASAMYSRAALGARKAVWRASGRQIVHLLHIGKTGGTAVSDALAEHSRTATSILIKEGHRVHLRHVPRGERIVFFLRDPVTRFISGFNSRRRMGRPRFYSPWSAAETEAFSRFETAESLGCALASGDRETRAAAERAMRGIYHVNSHFWDWFGDEAAFRARLDDVLFAGRQERLAEDFEQLKALLGVPPGVVLPSDDQRSHRSPEAMERRLSDVAIAALTDWYRDDYAFIDLCERTVNLRPVPGPGGVAG